MNNSTAFIFPGQGAQYPGMGKELFSEFKEARKVYNEANEILGFDLAKICFEGDKEELNKTSICQPAILVTSIAILRILESRGKNGNLDCRVTGGLSLGEYTAHVYAGSISFKDAVHLVHMRGTFMQEACKQQPGGMVAILKINDDDVQKLCEQKKEFGVVCVANYNSPGQVVISGETKALEEVSNAVKERGGKAVKLKVDGAFHSSLMRPAKDRLEKEINKTTILKSKVPIITNVTGKYVSEPDEIRTALVKQLDNPVLWKQSMENLMEDGITKFCEFGPGKVLTGLLQKIDSTKEVKNIESIKSIEECLCSI